MISWSPTLLAHFLSAAVPILPVMGTIVGAEDLFRQEKNNSHRDHERPRPRSQELDRGQGWLCGFLDDRLLPAAPGFMRPALGRIIWPPMKFRHTNPIAPLALWLLAGVLASIATLARSDGAAPAINPVLLTKRWSARWITVSDSSPFDYAVYHFRRTIELPTRPASFAIQVTGGLNRLSWD